MTDQPIQEVATAEGPDKTATVKLVAIGVLLAAFVVFAVQNSGDVEVDFLSWSFAIPLILVIVASAAVGVLGWQVVGLIRRRR